MALEIGPIALDPAIGERLQEIMLEGKAKLDVTLLEDEQEEADKKDSQQQGEAAQLVLQRRWACLYTNTKPVVRNQRITIQPRRHDMIYLRSL